MKTTILIDADILAFKVSQVNQTTYDWGDGEPTVHADYDKTCEQADEKIQQLKEDLDADEVAICLSDDYMNFRKKILPTYKAQRTKSNRPELLYELKEHLFNNYKSYRKDTLEADDVMGILATHPSIIRGKKIIVSEDKDMKTIPGYLYNPNQSALGVQQISEHQANWFWMYQTLVGDRVDNYKGCPKIGEVKAEQLLEGIIHIEEMWPVVVETYESKGLTEADALVQARCARILRHTDYDFKKKEPKLWTPNV